MSEPLSLTFVIPVLNDAVRLERCLSAIAANRADGVDVVVVDNGSTDGSARVAAQSGARVLCQPGASIAALRNAGAHVATGDVLAFVDADNYIGPAWVSAARSVLADPEIAAAGTVYVGEGRTWVQRTDEGLRSRSPVARRSAWMGSGNLAVRRSVFNTAGGFDERLQTCEDVDLCRRLRAAGCVLVDDPSLVSVHGGAPATLEALFFGELWRGRDNLVVSFRRPIDWRGVTSAGVSIAVLVAAAAGVIAAGLGAVRLWLLAAGVIGAVVAMRVSQLCANLRDWRPITLVRGSLVAAVYELGRAAALVIRVGHRARRAADRHAVEPVGE